jgi:hypothetical protein
LSAARVGCSEKDQAKVAIQQEKASAKAKPSQHVAGPPDDLDLEMELLLVSERFRECMCVCVESE